MQKQHGEYSVSDVYNVKKKKRSERGNQERSVRSSGVESFQGSEIFGRLGLGGGGGEATEGNDPMSVSGRSLGCESLGLG